MDIPQRRKTPRLDETYYSEVSCSQDGTHSDGDTITLDSIVGCDTSLETTQCAQWDLTIGIEEENTCTSPLHTEFLDISSPLSSLPRMVGSPRSSHSPLPEDFFDPASSPLPSDISSFSAFHSFQEASQINEPRITNHNDSCSGEQSISEFNFSMSPVPDVSESMDVVFNTSDAKNCSFNLSIPSESDNTLGILEITIQAAAAAPNETESDLLAEVNKKIDLDSSNVLIQQNHDSGEESFSDVSSVSSDELIYESCESDGWDEISSKSHSIESDASSDSDVSSGNDIEENEFTLKLHKSTDVTTAEAVYKILKIYLDHKCSKKCLQATLSTICSLLPHDHDMPPTLFLLFKYVENIAPQIIERKHLYCSECLMYFGITPEERCPICRSHKQPGSFFEFDIEQLVKFLFEHQNLADIIDNAPLWEPSRDNTISDIRDGSAYKDLNRNRSKYDLTMILNCDGLKLRKSSSKDLWLLMLMPIEVPIHLRAKYICIIGVWLDDHQPNMSTFLKPFCEKLREIYQNHGVTWKHPSTGEVFKSQVIAPMFIADAPARAKIQNISNFNGKYGCNVCEVKTVRAAPIPGKRRIRVYARNIDAPLREGRRMVHQGKRALELDRKIKGVKGPSILSVLDYIDLSLCVFPEYMHAVLLGVVRQLMYLWFHKAGPWSCREFEDDINKFLRGIRTPDFIQRKPRDIAVLKLWKASEFYNWLLYFSVPALKGKLPEEYYQHYLLFVRSVHTLLKSTILESKILEAENQLKLFVYDMERIYTDRDMTYNIHQLLHLGLTVRRWGPLFANSAFEFEDMNGIISKTIHGNKHLAKEIVINIKLSQGINVLKSKCDAKFEDEIIKANTFCKVLGRKFTLNLSQNESALLISAGIMEAHYGYKRAKVGGSIFTCSLYKQLKTANYFVSWVTLEGNMYGSVRFFIEYENKLFAVIDMFAINHVNLIYHVETRKAVQHILPFTQTNQAVVIEIKQEIHLRKELCVGNYICKRPNVHNQVM